MTGDGKTVRPQGGGGQQHGGGQHHGGGQQQYVSFHDNIPMLEFLFVHP